MNYTCFRIEKSGAVATVYLANPSKRNAMGPAFWDELPQVFAGLDSDPDVRAIVLSADGPVWSAGLDLVGIMPRLQAQEGGAIAAKRQLLQLIQTLQAAISSVERTRQPVIAAIHGKCIGGGVDLITACDFRLCSSDAVFSVREVRMAIVADVGTLQRLPRIVGEGHARELCYTGDDIGAEHAHRIGLVNHVYGSREALLAAAHELAARIAKNSPLAVQGTKAIMVGAHESAIREGLGRVAMHNTAFLVSEDLSEAMASFLEKREATYSGR
jgi:enoyl-CoA hydratase